MDSVKRNRDIHARVEDHLALDVNALARMGALAPGVMSKVLLEEARFPLEVSVSESKDAVTVSHWGRHPTCIPLVKTPCAFGGDRTWFLCPREGCGRRVAKLYLTAIGWGCRVCGDLRYTSQLQDKEERHLSQALAIRKRLGGAPKAGVFFPPKPERMHWRKYDRLMEKARRAEDAYLDAWANKNARLLASALDTERIE
jgi:hypothetical protein